MKTTPSHPENTNIVDIFSGKSRQPDQANVIVRLAPEYDGLTVLYSNKHSDPDKLFTMKIACWALMKNGDTVGMIPWLNKIIPCTDLNNALNGFWEGYFNTQTEEIFFDAPEHKIAELDHAALFFSESHTEEDSILQEIPDTIGTHALLTGAHNDTLILTEVISWRLMRDGDIHAMLIDETKIKATPVLVGDPCLYPADSDPHFHYFFQHNIANQIKSEDPAALAAVAKLFNLE